MSFVLCLLGSCIAQPPCEQAWEELSQLQAGMRAIAPGAHAPERTTFLNTCNDLPLAMQRCLSTKYALAHRTDCSDATSALDAAQRASLQEL